MDERVVDWLRDVLMFETSAVASASEVELNVTSYSTCPLLKPVIVTLAPSGSAPCASRASVIAVSK